MTMDGEDYKLFGFYRAKVTQVDLPDYKDFGAIRIFVPDIMDSELDVDLDEESSGLIAFPANNPLGGRNIAGTKGHATGTVYVPRVGSWIWCFFESGNASRPFYWNALDIQNTKLPPENRLGIDGSEIVEPHRVYTIIKTYEGRAIIVSDDEDTQRIEITGKKSDIDSINDPEGVAASTYKIDDNMTTILFDERTGKEKILIRTRLGDFFHIDVDEQELQIYFKNDIKIKTDGNFHLTVGENFEAKVVGETHLESTKATFLKSSDVMNLESKLDLNLKTDTKFNMQSGNNMSIKSGGKINNQSSGDMDLKSGGKINSQSSGDLNLKSGGNFNAKGTKASIKAITQATLQGGVKATVKAPILSLSGAPGSESGISTTGPFTVEAEGDVTIKSVSGKIFMESKGDTNIKSGGKINTEASDINLKGAAKATSMDAGALAANTATCLAGYPTTPGAGATAPGDTATSSETPPAPEEGDDPGSAQVAPTAATSASANPEEPVGIRDT